MNEQPTASGSASVPTTVDPLLSSIKPRKKPFMISDSATDRGAKPKTIDDSSLDQTVKVKQKQGSTHSSVQRHDSGEDLEVYDDSTSIEGTGGGKGADENISVSCTLPSQDAGPGTSTSGARVDGNTRPLAEEENGRKELVEIQKKKMELKKNEIKINERIQQLEETGHNSRTTSAEHLNDPGPAVQADPVSDTAKATDNGLRYVVIDGSNVAMSHGNDKVYSCKGIKLCVDFFVKRGHQVKVLVSLTKSYKNQTGQHPAIQDQPILDKLKDEGYLCFTPARNLGNKAIVCHDDHFILTLAKLEDAVIVSMDNFREFHGKYHEIITNRVLSYMFADDHFMPSIDPLGRNGPTLEQFLSKRPIQPARQGPVMLLTEDPVYPVSIAPGRRGERGEGGYLAKAGDKPSLQPSLPSLQKADTGNSTSATNDGTTTATVDEKTSIQSQSSAQTLSSINSREQLTDPGDAVQACPVSGVSGVIKKEKNGPAKVVEWMFMMRTLLSMKCMKLLTGIKVYKFTSLVSDGIFWLCSWIPFHITKGVAGLVPLCFLLFLWCVLPNDLENEYFQEILKDFWNIVNMVFFLKRSWEIILYIKDQEYDADATANPLLYSVLCFLSLLFIQFILMKKNHVATKPCFTILVILYLWLTEATWVS